MPSLCPGWNFFSNHRSDDDGRIILIWCHPVTVSIISQSRQQLTCEITLPGLPAITFTAIYAANTSQERSDLWTELTQLHSTYALDSRPWLMGGDFNQILHVTEQSVPFDYNNSNAMYQFRDTLLQLGMFDFRYQGPRFSWSNKQQANPLAKKIDRMLMNYGALQSYPHATTFFLAPMISDHSPCLIDLAFQLPRAGTHPFKFLNYLTKHPNFHHMVEEAWSQAGSMCMNLASLCWKLKNIKRELKQLNKDNFSNIQERVQETYRLLQMLQVQSLQTPTAESFLQESILSQKWHFLREIEESYFKQKSRINWLHLGDQNTTFF